ncbi:extracellular solute-binding protein [Paenibacillus thalictri]|uniref:Extracellular solute-binding protein n=1 Tax=Paenibacillus thalictri TaxID=2527873 RepID=A0A4Q9DFI6_9BACL|nr:extracellular solute-binding protein [Paenibacillus thalictri]TBL70745.1 extracellular solute-binding protein [Paenibacillus thalictri]
MKTNLRKGIALTCLAATTLVVIQGCGSASQGNNSSSAAGNAPSGPTEISMMVPFYNAQPPATDTNDVFKKIQEYTNTNIKVIWSPDASYADKLSVTLASGSLPKAIVVPAESMKKPFIVNAAQAGAFWEIGSYLKDFPNLKTYVNDVAIANTSFDGKVYGLYRARPLGRIGLIIRQDWLDNLGLQMPKTMDDFYNVAKAFTTQDPDKNGKDDTYGFAYADDPFYAGINTLVTANGGFNGWGVKDGKVTPDFITPQYMDVMKLFGKMYQEKLLNQDFAIVKGSQKYDAFNQGKAGMMFTSIDNITLKYNDLLKLTPSAKLNIAPTFTGPSGQKTNSTPGHQGVFMFPKSSVTSEAELKKILAYFDKMLDPQMVQLQMFGIEGKHMKMENGSPMITDAKAFADEVSPLQYMAIQPAWVANPNDAPLTKLYKQRFEENEKFLVANVTDPLISQTYSEKGTELDKIAQDARVKFVMGQIDEAGYNKLVSDWKTKGGDKVIEEYSAAYNKTQKK